MEYNNRYNDEYENILKIINFNFVPLLKMSLLRSKPIYCKKNFSLAVLMVVCYAVG